jgi:hypothetical protein
MSRWFSLIALALAAAAAAASIAQADTAGNSSASVDPLAVSYLMGRGLSPSEVAAWTTGICSHATKPALCFAPFERAAAASSTSASIARGGGFNWGDASIGAGASLGAALLLIGMGAAVLTARQARRREVAGT